MFSLEEWAILQHDRTEMGFIPLGDLYYGPSGAHLNVLHDGRIQKIRPSRQACVAPLASISRSRLNFARLSALPELSSETREWWSWLSGDVIRRNLQQRPARRRVIARKFTRDDVTDTLRWGVMQKGHTHCSHPVFKVPKGPKESRLILDCRALNEVLPKPGDMGLPNIHDVFDSLLQCAFIAQVDAKSYFYQFPLDAEAQKWFGCTVGSQRGALQHLRFTVLPMGYKFAPGIAQQTAMHLLRNLQWNGVKLAWVDNFLFGGESEEHVRKGLTNLRCCVAG
jgi:hypothetical protein